MNKKMFKLSAIQAAFLLTLSGCVNDNKSSEDVPPTAKDVTIKGAKQWISASGNLQGYDQDGDSLDYSFYENDESIESIEGVYTFSHGQMTLDGNQFEYTSFSGEDASIDYTVTANGASASATIEITNVANDPLAYQQWHLRNTGQKAYALSDEMKQGLIDLEIYTAAEADDRFEEAEAEELVAGEDMNVLTAYSQGVTGAGVTAVVVDTGLEIRHEDLIDNVLANRSLNLDESAADRTDPTSLSNSGDHGTSVAGLIAAKGWNNIGSRGVAPDTGLIGMNYLGSDKIEQTDLLVHGFPGSGISTDEEISAFNRSYGITYPASIAYSALDEAIESYPNLTLRSGKGALNMKSSGNSFEDGRGEGSLCADNGANELGLTCYNSAFQPSHGHPYYLNIAAVNANGKHTSYSTAGASMMVSAPAGEYGRYAPAMVTTDQMTCINGYSGFNGGTISAWSEYYGEDFAASQFPFNYPGHPENTSCNYTSTFNGTSSAAPNASGVVSLILSANPELTWRDVRHILASTSTVIDAEDEKVELTIGDGTFVAHDGWVENAAGYYFNNLYGFGRVDAGAAVAMALSYSENLGEQIVTDWQGAGSTIGDSALEATIPDNSATGISQQIEVTEDVIIEAMQFEFVVRNDHMGAILNDSLLTSAGNDLALEVVSPSGTRSVLLSSKQALLDASYSFETGYSYGYILDGAVLLSNAFYGENAKGTWTIRALDTGETNIDFSNTDNYWEATGLMNNPVESVLEGVSLRTFGRAAQ
ncbi:serine protease [Microbulbifer sp. A4B17]|uniref:S8 family serine peptidase n=1 Tax=Microbulbifer sp. A4B17 TaxID=359370 RepID=UPI000D52E498|nr:S8 family serine peptidase [Microbulbifer sp. A4B17]AWF81172.1 serine protease [Microbulbifer sp. A4B17]